VPAGILDGVHLSIEARFFPLIFDFDFVASRPDFLASPVNRTARRSKEEKELSGWDRASNLQPRAVEPDGHHRALDTPSAIDRHASGVERSVKDYLPWLLSSLDWVADGEGRIALAFAGLISLVVSGFGLCRSRHRLARSFSSRLYAHRHSRLSSASPPKSSSRMKAMCFSFVGKTVPGRCGVSQPARRPQRPHSARAVSPLSGWRKLGLRDGTIGQ
jgi:hypothetical protein